MFSKTLSLIAFTTIYLISSTGLYAQEDVKVKTINLTDKLHMLIGKGGNVGVFVGDDGTFVIDDQFAPLTEKLMTAIKAVGGDAPRFLINTHFHGDHTGGNENFGNKGALIVAHDNVRERLANGSMIEAFGMETPPAKDPALPAVTYSNNMHFHINQDNVSIVHAPNAHTDGDSFVHFEKSNVVHAGDIFFNGFYPFIDAQHGGSLTGTIAAVDAILALSDVDTKIIPGHGPLADKPQLQVYRDMLQTAYSNLSALKNEGLSVDDAKARQPLAELDALWGGAMFSSDRWLEIIYPDAVK